MTDQHGAAPEPPMGRTYLSVVIIEIFVLLALFWLQQHFSL
jgi:hypothetical protein